MLFIRNILAIIVSMLGMLLFVPILILGLFLQLISSLTQIITHLIEPKCQNWTDIVEFNPKVGWKPIANLNTHYKTMDNEVCHTITDSEGWLGKKNFSESDIVVVGDSYAFGWGVDIGNSYIEVDPNLRIKAVGSPGYSMVHELILMRQLSTQLAEKLVVWFICLQNDLYDNLRPENQYFYRTPFVRNVNDGTEWEIVTSHVNSTKWPYPTLKENCHQLFGKSCMQGPLSKHVYSACNFLIREGHDTCKKVGAHLVVMTIPCKEQLKDFGQSGRRKIASHLVNVNENEIDPAYPDQRFSDICSKLGIPFYAGRNFLNLKDYKIHDCHWTEQGNRRVARFLADIYNDYATGNLHAV